MARGRKSKASLTVAPVKELRQIPEPPEQLTPKQGGLWRTVMESSAGGFIEVEAYPVLIEYCRAAASGDMVASELDRFDPKWAQDDEGLQRWNKLLQIQDRAQGRVASLAVKLRLTPSSRVRPETAGRAERNHSGKKPWQFEG